MLGPAFVAAIAYVDPGNFATNIAGGAKFGYLLLWVVLAANLMAMVIQYLSAKLGIVTDRNLPEHFREHYSRRLSIGMWVQAELISMSTDIAEFIGAALGLNLLFHVPLLVAGVMTGFIAFGILELQPPRLQGLRARDHGPARADLHGLPLRDAQDRAVCSCGRGRPGTPLRRHRIPLSRRRDHRCDGHAARDLSALGADQQAHRLQERRGARQACFASSGST